MWHAGFGSEPVPYTLSMRCELVQVFYWLVGTLPWLTCSAHVAGAAHALHAL